MQCMRVIGLSLIGPYGTQYAGEWWYSRKLFTRANDVMNSGFPWLGIG